MRTSTRNSKAAAAPTSASAPPIAPRPFLKWAGGKGQLLRELLARLPERFATYHEPFVGGGALFFALVGRGMISRAVLSDANGPLIDTYLAVRDRVDDVIAALGHHPNEAAHFYRVRALDPDDLSLAEKAARVIFLNRTCYNGLHRENRAGQFNVPFGRYTNPRICDDVNLRACSRALRDVEVLRADFTTVLDRAKPGDLVYFDPPYHPVSKTASFTAYDRNGFDEMDQASLRDVFAELARQGVQVVLSNSATPLVRRLFRGFRVERVLARRAINSKGERRGRVAEVIVASGNSAGEVGRRHRVHA